MLMLPTLRHHFRQFFAECRNIVGLAAAPAASTFFLGSEGSTCSNPSVARMAILRPFNSPLINIPLLSRTLELSRPLSAHFARCKSTAKAG